MNWIHFFAFYVDKFLRNVNMFQMTIPHFSHSARNSMKVFSDDPPSTDYKVEEAHSVRRLRQVYYKWHVRRDDKKYSSLI